MIMSANNRGSISENRCLKGFPWMNNRRSQTSYRNRMNTDDPIFLIEEEHHKVFPVHVGKIGLKYRARIGRAADLLLIARHSSFSHQRDFVNRNTWLFALRNLFFS